MNDTFLVSLKTSNIGRIDFDRFVRTREQILIQFRDGILEEELLGWTLWFLQARVGSLKRRLRRTLENVVYSSKLWSSNEIQIHILFS